MIKRPSVFWEPQGRVNLAEAVGGEGYQGWLPGGAAGGMLKGGKGAGRKAHFTQKGLRAEPD